MIEVFEPRYRDRVVLLAKYRLQEGRDQVVRITKGAYKGDYMVTWEDIKNAKDDVMSSKTGFEVKLKAVALDKLKPIVTS